MLPGEQTTISPSNEASSLAEGEDKLNAQHLFSQAPDPASGSYFYYRAGVSTRAGFGVSSIHYRVENALLHVKFPGSNPVMPVGVEALGSVTSYFFGSNPDAWRAGLTDYRAIIYEDLYPGIDLQYKIVEGALKYEFVVEPGADPSAIKMEFVNADSLVVQPCEVRATIGTNCLVDKDLVVFQQDGDVIHHIESEFELCELNVVTFSISAYDESKVLVIDPVPNIMRYNTLLGGNGSDVCMSIAVDNGFAYVTGYTDSKLFNITNGFDWTYNGGLYDVFVAKMSLNGSSLVYCTYLGTAGDDRGYDIDVESNYAYITGQASGTTIWGTSGYDRTRNGGVYDAFVTKLGTSGSTVVYASYLGGNGDDYGESISVENGYAYVAGYTDSPTFNTTAAFDQTPNGNIDAFVTKMGTTGTTLSYSTLLGGADTEYAYGIDVENGYAYVAGNTASNPFNTTADAYDNTFNGASFFDGFITKLNALGTALVYSTYLGGTNMDYIRDIVVEEGISYVVGDTESLDIPVSTGAYDSVQNGAGGTYDVFIAKMSFDGASLAYCTYLGGTMNDYGRAITVQDGSAYVTGSTTSSTFPITAGAFDSTYQGTEAFVTKMSPDGTRLEYSTFLGGSSSDYGHGIAAANKVVYTCGATSSSNFPTTAGAFDRTIDSYSDGFVAMLGEDADSDGLPDDWEATYGLSTTFDNSELDSDADGLSDETEYSIGTIPNDVDSDNDWMPDAWEYINGLNPRLISDANGDLDLDLLSNFLEYQHGTDPGNDDSDDDGLSDRDEVIVHGTDPNDEEGDADNDGLTDVTEITIHGSNPHKVDTDNDNLVDAYEAMIGTSLTDADTDGDGFDDGDEVARGTDPDNINSNPGSSTANPLLLDMHDYVVMFFAASIGFIALLLALILHGRDTKAIKQLENKINGQTHGASTTRDVKSSTNGKKKQASGPGSTDKEASSTNVKQGNKK
ncbi:MAG: hypothetical protein GYA24_21525 [Candidatus Lokiarchaeota archaeon]|nr:hypothetical protein [Candidatus Lokiarchaeota archaeon]